MSKVVERHPTWVKVLHWVHTFSMILLIFSGFYITYANAAFLFPRMRAARLWHFYAAWIIVWMWVARIYFGLVTGEMKSMFINRKDLGGMPGLMRYYLFLSNDLPDYGKYNPGQKMLYNLWPILLLFQAITGFMLYSPQHFQYLWGWHWVVENLNTIRVIHYFIAVFFTITTAAHLYLVLTEDMDKLRDMVKPTPREEKKRRRS